MQDGRCDAANNSCIRPWLEGVDEVSRVLHPALPSHKPALC